MNAPSPRAGQSVTWTDSGLVVWGGRGSPTFLADGARYDPTADAWRPIPEQGAPPARFDHSAVWAGESLIVWGGSGCGSVCGDGASLDLAHDTWTPLPTSGAPSARTGQTAIWTGREMLIWGGNTGNQVLRDGARYDPAARAWRPISGAGAPTARTQHVAVWTGYDMVIWGGQTLDRPASVDGGVRYDPLTDTWTPMQVSALSGYGYGATATWTGSDLFVTYADGNYHQTGSRLDSSNGRWSLFGQGGTPTVSRLYPSVMWTGQLLLLWGGYGSQKYSWETEGGAAFDPTTNIWSPLPVPPLANGPAIWNGHELFVWGGEPHGRLQPER